MRMNITSLFALSFVLCGCATNLTYFKAHNLAQFTKNDISLVQGGNIETSHGTVVIRFEEVDSVKLSPELQAIRGEGLWRIQVTPGKHKIYSEIRFKGKAFRANLVHDFPAGKICILNPAFDDAGAMIISWKESEITDNEFKQK